MDIVRDLLAVQAQDLRAARLALRARGELFTATDVDAALTHERSLVRGWLGRSTLHFVAREDYWWLHELTSPRAVAGNTRRLRQLGVSEKDAERAVAVVEAALADNGPLSRKQLAERMAGEGIPAEGQATPHLLLLASLRGLIVLGPVRPGSHDFALARDWVGESPDHDREAALAELARRYLTGHGPASAADLSAWIGLPLRDARAGIAAISDELIEVGDDMVDLLSHEPAPERVPARLLPAYDPFMLGWRDRDFAVPAELAREVHPGGGVIRPTALVDGLVAGTWSRRDGLQTFDPVSRGAARQLEAEAKDVLRFEGA